MILAPIAALLAALAAPQLEVSASTTSTTVVSGAPTKTISALCYDADGFLLVGTTGGLARYDGYQFETLESAKYPGLESDRILALHQDRDGRIWVGADAVAPCTFENGRFRQICDPHLLHSVHQILEASDGSIWLVGRQLARFQHGRLEVFGEADGLPEESIRRIVEAPDGSLWVGTKQGVFRLEGSAFRRVDERPSRWVTLDFEGHVWTQGENCDLIALSGPPAGPLSLGAVEIRDELPRTKDSRILATSTGLVLMRPSVNEQARLKIEPLTQDTRAKGSRRSIACLLPATGRDFWRGTELQGLQYTERRYVELEDIVLDAPGQPVFHVHQLPNGKALVNGGALRMAFVLDAQRGRTPVQVLDQDDHHSLESASTDAGTWLATRGGLSRLDGHVIVPDKRWRGGGDQIVAHPDGSVWMEHDGRLQQVVAPGVADEDLESYPLPSGGITAICVAKGSIVVANMGHLYQLQRASGAWTPIADTGSAAIRQLRAGPSGEIWISTYGQGLWRRRADGSMDQWSKEAGIPDRFLAWLAPLSDSGDLWINSNSGLIRVSIASLNAYAAGEAEKTDARSFRAPEANGARGAELASGFLALPTLEGLAIFNRSAVPAASTPPRVKIRGPFVNGVHHEEAPAIEGRAHLHYSFTAPIFPTSKLASFQYRIAELDEQWIDAGKTREVHLPGQPSGSYTLEVRARAPTGMWSDPTRSATLVVPPYWYDRTWVRWLLAGAVVLTLQALLLRRTRVLKRRNKVLTREMNHRRAAEYDLQLSERRFRRLFQTAPSAILSWTPDGDIMDTNERADRLFDWGSEADLPAEPWALFEDATLGKETIRRAFIDYEDLTLVAMTRVGHGIVKRCRWRFAPTRTSSGEAIMITAMVNDLSRQDRDARRLSRLRESLVSAEEAERSRIARELHDDLSQRLAALALEAHMVDLDRAKDQPAEDRPTHSFRREIEQVATHLHTLSRQLHPTIIDDLGLKTALKSECSRRNQSEGAPIALTLCDGVEDLPPGTPLALFRIAQEAMRNAARHAEATAIKVSLGVDGDWVELSVTDNGIGIQEDQAKNEPGIGMNSMRERARLAGGDLVVRPHQGGGTQVMARVPRHAEALRHTMALRGD